MPIKLIASAAVGLVVFVGSTFAADQFTLLDSVNANPLNHYEMDAVRGTTHFSVDATAEVSTAVSLPDFSLMPLLQEDGARIGVESGELSIHFYPPDPIRTP